MYLFEVKLDILLVALCCLLSITKVFSTKAASMSDLAMLLVVNSSIARYRGGTVQKFRIHQLY